MEKSTGKIKFFNSDKGFGFIIQDNSESELFVHITDVNGRKPREDDRVEYTIGEGKKGAIAKEVTVI